ncbi:outer membrane protein assembly factor BamB family protein [Streptomyces bambusae]|uniref:PQQ-binding-like beta-propeller repeat protein n=1 Tax=Streptomyces bambusae TaxID=1550616 RepID=A0ABS6ZF32_9ACTN|nr:PQQ-binding-like beta-propeller repeat protein [Streptomyces bambusae]MBW5486341.1 PQQ-binding-like beta-propeller repeat protein [Streptomyces bambusae]
MAVGLGLLLVGGVVGGYLVFGTPAGAGRAPVRSGEQGPHGAGGELVTPWAVTLGGTRSRVHPAAACSWQAGALYCSGPGLTAARLNPADGSLAWSLPAPAPAARTTESGAPLHAGGLVLAVAAGGDLLQALDPATGAERWKRKLPQGAKVVPAGPYALVAGVDGSVTGLDAATGGQRWAKRIGDGAALWCAGPEQPGSGPPVLYAAAQAADGASTQVMEVDPATGAVRRQVRAAGLVEPVGVAQGGLYLLESDKASLAVAVVRMDLGGGGRPGMRRTPLSAPLLQAQAAVDADGAVYVFGTSGALVAVRWEPDREERGREEWRLETGMTVASRPVPSGGRVYLSAPDGRLVAVDAGSRRLVGQTKPRMADGQNTYAAALAAPVVVGGRVFATAPDGTVFAVPADQPEGW